MKKYLMLFGIVGLIVSIASCGRMNDVHSKYRNETIYSGKVSNIRGYAGIGKVYLAWDNPVDYKSKAVLIAYYAYEDSVDYVYFSADDYYVNGRITVDSTIIDGLTHDATYTFEVYTLDADSNKSITESIMVTPMTRETADGLAGPTVGYAEGYYETWTYNNSGLADAAGTRHPEPTEGRVVFVKNSSLSVTETFIKPLSSDGNVTFKIQNLTNTWIKWAGGVSFSLKDVSGRVINSGMELNLPMDSINVRYEGTSREERKTYSVDYYCFDSKENLSSDLYVVDYGVVGYPIVSGSPLYDTCTVRGSEEINILLADSDDDGE